jgi:hypothetical protein
VYGRKIDDRVLTLSASGWTYNRQFVLYDYETESIWYDLGDGWLTCVAGEYEGRRLPERVSDYTTWDRWKRSYPDTRLYRATRPR